ncbi:MAG: transposase family protein [Deltaproteobacteria bacterium]|nr:transposase family protein [Deltaproteobacteria bacterium]
MFLFDGNQTGQKGVNVCPPVYFIMDLEFKAIIMFERPAMTARSFFSIKPAPFSLCCPICGSKDLKHRGTITRMFKTVPIGAKAVFIQLPVQRVQCLCCDAIRQAKLPFAQRRRNYTNAFERYALALSRHMTILDVAKHLGVRWDVIKDIQKRCLSRKSITTLIKRGLNSTYKAVLSKTHRALLK